MTVQTGLDLGPLGVGGDVDHQWMLRREHAEGHPEAGVGTGGEHGEGGGAGRDCAVLGADRHLELRTVRAPDPVALHGLDLVRPVEMVEVVK